MLWVGGFFGHVLLNIKMVEMMIVFHFLLFVLMNFQVQVQVQVPGHWFSENYCGKRISCSE
jgi:uncharacterized PurR-regulated membrane protein YhhQ (DUF165 family)